jgi:hypothetical protein
VTDAIRLDQALARKAAQLLDGGVDAELRTRMRALPIMVQTSGLAATAAFLLARRKTKDGTDPYGRTARLILNDAAEAAGIEPRSDDPERLLAQVAGASPAKYLLAESRARQLAIWLARLAQAFAERSQPERSRPESSQQPPAGGAG